MPSRGSDVHSMYTLRPKSVSRADRQRRHLGQRMTRPREGAAVEAGRRATEAFGVQVGAFWSLPAPARLLSVPDPKPALLLDLLVPLHSHSNTLTAHSQPSSLHLPRSLQATYSPAPPRDQGLCRPAIPPPPPRSSPSPGARIPGLTSFHLHGSCLPSPTAPTPGPFLFTSRRVQLPPAPVPWALAQPSLPLPSALVPRAVSLSVSRGAGAVSSFWFSSPAQPIQGPRAGQAGRGAGGWEGPRGREGLGRGCGAGEGEAGRRQT